MKNSKHEERGSPYLGHMLWVVQELGGATALVRERVNGPAAAASPLHFPSPLCRVGASHLLLTLLLLFMKSRHQQGRAIPEREGTEAGVGVQNSVLSAF